ncbi:hypothetical protein [Treponema pectinovorum]|uniref:hypothetical protein n=1 Tax=Treponema pectinovorum TaxID=164 RepID=UPI0011CAB765|nr:hypothetical protein [Treponema pectinovorum]
MSKIVRCLVSFWLWIAVILVSFMMLVISIVASHVPTVAVAIFAVVIFAMSLTVAIVNPGIFAKQTTTATAT